MCFPSALWVLVRLGCECFKPLNCLTGAEKDPFGLVRNRVLILIEGLSHKTKGADRKQVGGNAVR